MKKESIFNKLPIGTISTIIFFLSILILIVVRVDIIMDFPINGYIDYVDDDQLQVHQAKSIMEGNWLGTYGYNTLLKGPVFPLFLALIATFKIPYIFSITVAYIIACCFFIYSIKDVIKNKLALLIIFVCMLFNPIMFSYDFQRVYRNSLTPTLAVALISFFNIVLINRSGNKIFKYLFGIIFASIIFPFFYYIREDSIWIVPFVLFYSFIIIVSNIREMIKYKCVKFIKILKTILVVLPLITLIIFEQIIGSINLSHYGGKIVNQSDFESLNNVIHTMNIVKNVDGNKEVTNSREKIKMLYTISPSLALIKENFEFSMDILTGGKDREISDGMFLWGFLSGVSMSWYSTYQEQNELFKNIDSEIKIAIENNTLETQELFPIFNDALKDKFNFEELLNEFNEMFRLINDYKSLKVMDAYESKVAYSMFFESRVREFLEMTNNKIVLEDNDTNNSIFGELVSSNQKEYIKQLNLKVENLNNIKKVYDVSASTLRVFGYISYIAMTIILIVDLIKKKEKYLLNNWLVTSGIFGAVMTLAAGVAYTNHMKIHLNNSFYLMSGYILNNIFYVFSIISVLDYFYRVMKNKFKKSEDNIEMRKAKMEELDEIFAIYKSLLGFEGCLWNEYYPSIDDIRKDIELDTMYILKLNDKIIASAHAGIDEALFKLDFFSKEVKKPRDLARVAVSIEYQKQGFARKLIKYIEDDLKKQDVDYMFLTVGKSNFKACNLYKSIGYEIKGEKTEFDIDWYCQEKKL